MFFRHHSFNLPPLAYWLPEQFKNAGPQEAEIRNNKLGWDITDFGSGNFLECGLLLFTLRNGRADMSDKCYAEKIMITREKQRVPFHFHWKKTEDIINRGNSGRLIIEFYDSTAAGGFAKTSRIIHCDGVSRTIKPGDKVVLAPGESVTIPPGLYHSFYGEEGKGLVLVGEVSSVNDDATDNRFYEPLPRFPAIEEDEPPYRLLCSEYPTPRIRRKTREQHV